MDDDDSRRTLIVRKPSASEKGITGRPSTCRIGGIIEKREIVVVGRVKHME